MTTPEQVRQLFDRFLAGRATPAEEAQLREWLAALPSGRGVEYSALLDRVRDRTADGLPAVDAASALAHVHDRMAGTRRAAPMRVGVWAAAACAVLAVGALVYGSHRAHGAWREYVTGAAQRESVTLPDGTKFTLAPASHLRVPVDYAAGNRAVTLEGEAFFAVMHDATHPFSVRATGAVVTDVGTQFDVRTYGDGSPVRVAVAEGQVSIETRRGRLLATRGDVAAADTALAVTHNADVDALTAWTNGRLVFHATPMVDVARELSRWYDLDVHVEGVALQGRLFSGSYTTETPDQVLSLVTAAIGAQYERHGRTVTIRLPE